MIHNNFSSPYGPAGFIFGQRFVCISLGHLGNYLRNMLVWPSVIKKLTSHLEHVTLAAVVLNYQTVKCLYFFTLSIFSTFRLSSQTFAVVKTNSKLSSALIISGGLPREPVPNSVEVFVPSTGQHCQLPDLPGDPRDHHTMEEMTVCGGYYSTSSETSCLTLIDGTWQTTTTLLEKR